ncbi:MAG: tyrosine--tRNA ligase [Rickettsiales bacterium]|jgi:tyrosyl-tRNA synthetase|nr:tyrosine--tRNA ligase [Rickettsiales bacterium]
MNNKDFINDMHARGFINQCSDFDGLQAALESGPITAYLGFDPTADSLHQGHLIPIMLLRWLQKYGNNVIMLVGGATGRIGDPSGRDTGRPMMTEEILAKNVAGLKKSCAKVCDMKRVAVVDNHDWMKKYSHMDFLAEFGTAFTVPHMLSMESVRRRLETGMTFLEFNYMTFQAVDFLHLYKDRGCALQLCGADQWGNSIMGIDLIRKKIGGSAFVLSTSIITDSAGNKVGKSAGNAVWLNEDKTSPYDYFQYFRNTPDDLVEKFLKLFTEFSLPEIAEIMRGDINEAKRRLAFAATEIVHGTDAAETAADAAAALFGCGDISNAPTAVYKIAATLPSVLDFCMAVGLFASKSEARRTIDQGGLTLNEERVANPDQVVLLQPGVSVLLKKGKKTFLRVAVE